MIVEIYGAVSSKLSTKRCFRRAHLKRRQSLSWQSSSNSSVRISKEALVVLEGRGGRLWVVSQLGFDATQISEQTDQPNF